MGKHDGREAQSYIQSIPMGLFVHDRVGRVGVDRARRRRVTQIAMRVGWGNHPTLRDRELSAFHSPAASGSSHERVATYISIPQL